MYQYMCLQTFITVIIFLSSAHLGRRAEFISIELLEILVFLGISIFIARYGGISFLTKAIKTDKNNFRFKILSAQLSFFTLTNIIFSYMIYQRAANNRVLSDLTLDLVLLLVLITLYIISTLILLFTSVKSSS